MIVRETGWTKEQLDDQPESLLEALYTIIVVDGQREHNFREQATKAWTSQR